MFKAEHWRGRLAGYGLQHEHVFFFFGARDFGREQVVSAFPEYECAFLKQVHGRDVIAAAPPAEPEADGHYTRRATRALVVQTADCVPVLLASKHQVCAIHAGWRGAGRGILAASRTCFADDPVLFAAIGPHILARGFEVGRDVAASLLASAPEPGPDERYLLPHPVPEKVHFDLTQLIRDQLRAAHGKHVRVFDCLHDTLSDLRFHSYRRDRDTGRQMSFVVLNS